jgi:hypothetical protein
MEPLWSPVVATGGNQSQVGSAPKPRKQAETVAVRCDALPREVHGKEGVDSGTSPLPRWRITGAHPSICRALLSSLGYPNRRSVTLKRERSIFAQPVFYLGDRDELEASAPNPTQLWPDVLVEEVTTASQRLCCLGRRERQPRE